jgi:hypothetical protein
LLVNIIMGVICYLEVGVTHLDERSSEVEEFFTLVALFSYVWEVVEQDLEDVKLRRLQTLFLFSNLFLLKLII